ncbi:response regulator transcription factor [Solirubrobacter soli]|uniref:response regulator transcription factor n=1 Tax=Solirubrobacter soli TaxID=363832 RepID=UPI00042958DE|nr:response regulator transcription factor [Solirubrobacter soli]
MPGVTRIGICEDDSGLRSVLARALLDEGFEVRTVPGGRLAVQEFSASPPDLLVLDIGLPDADGRDVCQALRAHGVTSPVIFLTARGELTDRLAGFHAGGDDYLTKPFALAELVVRVRALLKRAGVEPEPPPPAGALRLDPAAHGVRVGERAEALTPTEFRLLAALASRPGEVLRRRELVSAAWPDGAIVNANTLDAYIGRLRRKLRAVEAEQEIATARGVGYTLR